MKNEIELFLNILKSWNLTINSVIKNPEKFLGVKKELKVVKSLKCFINKFNPEANIIGPETRVPFRSWLIDLVIVGNGFKIAIEAKFKSISDGAVPDNRKAAFYDLYKLENYVYSEEYTHGFFFWLTNNPAYLIKATGDSKDFSTHNNREYKKGNLLNALRSRNNMPLPMSLRNDYCFSWKKISSNTDWYSLFFQID